jgi:hypothetical protein
LSSKSPLETNVSSLAADAHRQEHWRTGHPRRSSFRRNG